jgi:hypothetical protein
MQHHTGPGQDPFLATSDIPPQPPKKKSTAAVWLALGAVIFVLGICSVGAILAGSTKPVQDRIAEQQEKTLETPPPGLGVPDPGVRPSVTPTKPTPAPRKVAEPLKFGDGTYLVGDEIPAGTYKTPGASESAFQFCSWNVRSGEGSDADYLDGGVADKTKQQQRVKLKRGQVFDSQGCQDWVRQ